MTRPANGADLAVLGFSTYLRLTTFRRDGRPVSTAVWPVGDRADLGGHDQHLLVTTGAETGKAKRLRHTPCVLIAPCDARGHAAADVEDLEAVAEVLTARSRNPGSSDSESARRPSAPTLQQTR